MIAGDLLESSLAPAMRGIDVVIHLAARLHSTEQPADEYERVNVEGTRRLLAAAIESGVSRFVFASTIAVYGSGNAAIIDESTPPSPDTDYARTKRVAEELILAQPFGLVLRLASVYGPRIKGNYGNLVRAISKGRYIAVGSGRNRRTLIHEFDVGRAFVLAAESEGVPGSVLNVTDGQFHTLREIVDAIASALGRKPLSFHVPVLLARVGAAALDALKPSTHARALLAKYLEDLAVDGSRFEERTGFSSQVDLASGWEATIRGMRAAGFL